MSLDAAWAEVAALFPDSLIVISPSQPLKDGSRSPIYVEARTARPTAGRRGPRWFHWYGEGSDLASAFQALAAKYREGRL